jgi:predicted phosphoribosyltransferase
LRAAGASHIIFATPVGPPETIAALARAADAVVCLVQPIDFSAVGAFYEDFEQVSDEAVIEAIASCAIAARRR